MQKNNNTLTPELRTSLLNSVSTLTDFLNNTQCGCSYWVDFEGHSHSCDTGSVNDFLDDLERYLKSEELENKYEVRYITPFKKKPYTYKVADYEIDDDQLICHTSNDGTIRINLSAVDQLSILDLKTGKDITKEVTP